MKSLLLLMFMWYSTKNYSQVQYHHAHMNFNIDPNIKYINGNVKYYMFSASNTDTLKLNFSANLSIDSIIFHQQNITNYFFSPPDNFNIILPQQINGYDSIAIKYHGVPNTSGLGSFKQSFHGSAPIISTLSQPFGASDWLPCINNLRMKLDSITISVSCPNMYTAVANGVLKSVTDDGVFKTFTYKHHHPIATYLIGVTVSNYVHNTVVFSDNIASFPIENYIYPEEELAWMNNVMELPSVIHLYDSLFGKYPFADEQYGMAQTNFEGGMEHQTITFMGHYNYEIAAHELAHHWFGNKVTCGTWHDLWLNEGFATYLSGLAYQYLQNGFYWKPFLQGRMAVATDLSNGSVYVDDTTSISRLFDDKLTYNKAAMVIHQLRFIVGDSVFFAACKNYLNDVNLAYKFAFTNDLKYHFEASSGLDLTYYFDQWIYGEGYPIYQISATDLGAGNYGVQISYSTTSASTPLFKLPLPIKFIGNLQDTTIVFNCENNIENFMVHLNFVPQQFITDPELNVIAKSNAMLGINNNNKLNSCSLYPSIATNFVTIANNQFYKKYELLNCSGNVLLNGVFNSTIQENISIMELAKGMYFIKLIGAQKNEILKFIKN